MSTTRTDTASTEHWMEKAGVAWPETSQDDDFQPYLPRTEYDARIATAKRLLAKHGLDAMVLFA